MFFQKLSETLKVKLKTRYQRLWWDKRDLVAWSFFYTFLRLLGLYYFAEKRYINFSEVSGCRKFLACVLAPYAVIFSPRLIFKSINRFYKYRGGNNEFRYFLVFNLVQLSAKLANAFGSCWIYDYRNHII